MTKISAEIIADSICNGHRITTMKATMPRFILAEFNTHRMLSKNSASSRAIPFNKMVEMVKTDPFIPIAWQKDHKGMQGTEYFTDPVDIEYFVKEHLAARNYAIAQASIMHHHGATKQICNRYLEPFMWHTVLVTATEWENFFHLRCPQYEIFLDGTISKKFRSRKDVLNYFIKEERQHSYEKANGMSELDWLGYNKGQAEIHMMALAEAMWDARNESKPRELQPGEWHIPYDEKIEWTKFDPSGYVFTADEAFQHWKVKLSTAMCAQTSYTVIGEDGKPISYENLLDLHDSLLVRPYTNRKGVVFGPDDPIHTSPSEHCAQAMTRAEYKLYVRGVCSNNFAESEDSIVAPVLAEGWCHNLNGWKSYRSMIPNENRTCKTFSS